MVPKQTKHSSTRYQNVVLMDLEGNTVHTTLYDANITAFEDQLQLSKTYIISNALVKDKKAEYKASNGNVQWTISGKARVQEVNENHMELLFSTYTFTAFSELEKYADCNNDIVISNQPFIFFHVTAKRSLHFLIQFIQEHISSYLLTLNTKICTHDIYASILVVAIDIYPKRLIQTWAGNQTNVQDILLIDKISHTIILTMWDGYVEKECVLISDNITKKPVILATRLKVSSFNGLTLSTKINNTFFIDASFNQVVEIGTWIEAHNEELNDIVLEKPSRIVTPTKLSPTTHKRLTQIQNLKGRLLGHETDQSIATIAQMDAQEEYMFYIKVTQLEQNTTQYKYEIIFVVNALPTVTVPIEQQTEEDQSSPCFAEGNKISGNEETSTLSAKRVLFQNSAEPVVLDMLSKEGIPTPSSKAHQVTAKRKLD